MQSNLSLIPGLGRSPGEGNGYPLLYSSLENSLDRVAWRATTVHVYSINVNKKDDIDEGISRATQSRNSSDHVRK